MSASRPKHIIEMPRLRSRRQGTNMKIASVIACAALALGVTGVARADEFSKEDLARWQEKNKGWASAQPT